MISLHRVVILEYGLKWLKTSFECEVATEKLGLDHNSRLHARHRIYEEYLKSLEKRYSIKLNESDVYSPSMNDDYHNDPIGYDLLPESLLMSTSTAAAAPDNIDYVDDGLYSTLTPGQTDQSITKCLLTTSFSLRSRSRTTPALE
ncbi:unnamed protein product [Trichobilharzia regenti]|nr:unnamed protein product [Trichobilharzia regenti]